MSKILTIDVGRDWAWCFMDGGIVIEGESLKFQTINGFYSKVRDLILFYKPTVVGSAMPTFQYDVITFQSKMVGIIELCAERAEVEFVSLIDSQCKKGVLGKGVCSKDEIMKWASTKYHKRNQHIADAIMFAEFIYKKCCS